MGDPSPPLCTKVDTDVLHMIKYTRPSPSVFAYCKRSKIGQWKGLRMKLLGTHAVCVWIESGYLPNHATSWQCQANRKRGKKLVRLKLDRWLNSDVEVQNKGLTFLILTPKPLARLCMWHDSAVILYGCSPILLFHILYSAFYSVPNFDNSCIQTQCH